MRSKAYFGAWLLAGVLAASASALACERHMPVQASAAPTVVSHNETVPDASSAPRSEAAIYISPASAAAMATAEVLGTEPPAMRCPRGHAVEALTQ